MPTQPKMAPLQLGLQDVLRQLPLPETQLSYWGQLNQADKANMKLACRAFSELFHSAAVVVHLRPAAGRTDKPHVRQQLRSLQQYTSCTELVMELPSVPSYSGLHEDGAWHGAEAALGSLLTLLQLGRAYFLPRVLACRVDASWGIFKAQYLYDNLLPAMSATLTSLQRLTLSGCVPCPALVEQLSPLSHLTSLALTADRGQRVPLRIMQSSLDALAALAQLRSIALGAHTVYRDRDSGGPSPPYPSLDLSPLAAMPHLTSLRLGCRLSAYITKRKAIHPPWHAAMTTAPLRLASLALPHAVLGELACAALRTAGCRMQHLELTAWGGCAVPIPSIAEAPPSLELSDVVSLVQPGTTVSLTVEVAADASTAQLLQLQGLAAASNVTLRIFFRAPFAVNTLFGGRGGPFLEPLAACLRGLDICGAAVRASEPLAVEIASCTALVRLAVSASSFDAGFVPRVLSGSALRQLRSARLFCHGPSTVSRHSLGDQLKHRAAEGGAALRLETNLVNQRWAALLDAEQRAAGAATVVSYIERDEQAVGARVYYSGDFGAAG